MLAIEDYELFRELTHDLFYANMAGNLDEVYLIADRLVKDGHKLPIDLRFVLMAAINGVEQSLGGEYDSELLINNYDFKKLN